MNAKVLLALAVTVAAAAVPAAGQLKIVGYQPSWAGDVNQIQYGKLTHINYAFIDTNQGISVATVPDHPKLQSLVSQAHARGVEVSIAIGGWTELNNTGFVTYSSTEANRTDFVNRVVTVIDHFGLDGVDIDWEYPVAGTAQVENCRLLMQKLCADMHSRGKLCTAAVAADGANADGIATAVFSYVDWLNLMAYDGGTGAANSPYSYAVQSLDYWLGRGLPASKAVLGVPFYGRGPTWAASDFRAYNVIVANDPQAPFKDESQGFHYNGLQTIRNKTNLAKQRGGGVMFWELSQDATGSASLLSAIYETAGLGATPTPTPTPVPNGNLALNRPATASSVEAAGFEAGKGVDGNGTTRWSSTFADNQWLAVDLGSSVAINRVVLRWEAAYARSYRIETSNDGTTWTSAYNTTLGDGGVDDLGVSATGRHVRVFGVQRATAFGYSLFELEVYGSTSATPTPTPTARTPTPTPTRTPMPTPTSAGPTPTPTATPAGQTYVEITPPGSSVTASANDGNVPANAVDNSLATRWSANGDGQWLQLDLGSSRTVGYVKIAFYNGNLRRSRFDVQVSNVAGVWTNVLTGIESSGTTTQEQTFDFPDAEARWVRYLGHGNSANAWNSLYEVSVFALPGGVAPTATPTPTPGTVTPTATPTPTSTPTATRTPTPTPGVPAGNLALNRPAVASSVEGAGFEAGKAVDGSSPTRWSSTFADGQWLAVDLGSSVAVRRVVLRWEAAYGRAYRIETSSDNSTWTSAYGTSTSDGGVDDIAINATARYVRMFGVTRATPYGFSLYEMEVYATAGNGPVIVWSDEFDAPAGSPIDPAKWKHDVGGGGWGNNQLEYDTNRTSNSAHDGNGNLVITARRETYTGPDGVTRNYTSARINTAGKLEHAYGRFEARLKLPVGQGIWPAFWMLGNDIGTVNWPSCGEIDIMENVGNAPGVNHGSLHGPGYSGATPMTASYTLPGGARFADAFHTFAIEWEPSAVRWYVDGNLYQTRTPASLPAGTRWVFDHPFFVILNVAVGGNWPGSPDATTVFPQAMLVDYVRVYRLD